MFARRSIRSVGRSPTLLAPAIDQPVRVDSREEVASPPTAHPPPASTNVASNRKREPTAISRPRALIKRDYATRVRIFEFEANGGDEGGGMEGGRTTRRSGRRICAPQGGNHGCRRNYHVSNDERGTEISLREERRFRDLRTLAKQQKEKETANVQNKRQKARETTPKPVLPSVRLKKGEDGRRRHALLYSGDVRNRKKRFHSAFTTIRKPRKSPGPSTYRLMDGGGERAVPLSLSAFPNDHFSLSSAFRK